MALSRDRMERSTAALEDGRLLYTSGRFFEALAVWEGAWRGESGLVRRLFQGLMMAAGAYHKMAVHRQPVGMTILLERALDRLGPVPDGFAGLELARFRHGLERSLAEARAWRSGGPHPAGPAPLGASPGGQR